MKINFIPSNHFFYTIILCLIIIFISSCGEKQLKKKGLTLDDCPVVAYLDSSLVIMDISQVKDTFDFPINALFSSFEIVPLENSEEALVGLSFSFTVSDNYIGLANSQPSAYKLFDRKGKYICDISSVGSGPDEYFIAIYDSYIDEKNGRIYLLSYRANKLLVFDLQGNPLKHIPLPFDVHKGRFRVNLEKEEVLMMALPFIDTPYIIWKQDFEGNILEGITSVPPFIIEPGDYCNEIGSRVYSDVLNYSLLYCVPTADTLYHYQEERGSLRPVFSVKWKENDIRVHDYIELSDYYITRLLLSASSSYIPRSPQILIDKESLRGCYINFKYNMLGNIDGPSILDYNRGYCIGNMFPHELREQLVKVLSRPDRLTVEMLDKLKSLNNSITDDDNNILFIGKLK